MFLKSAENAVLNYPLLTVSEKQASRFANGGELYLERLHFKEKPKNGELYRVKNGDKFLGLGEVDYNKSALALKEINGNSLMGGSFNPNVNEDFILWMGSFRDSTFNGTVFTAVFEVLETAEPGKTEVCVYRLPAFACAIIYYN